MIRLRQHRSVRAELRDAAAWYETRRSGLGDEFLDEVDRALMEIRRAPLTWPRVPRIADEVHRLLIHRFPYYVIYRVAEREALIVAVAHAKRRPRYWRDRLRTR